MHLILSSASCCLRYRRSSLIIQLFKFQLFPEPVYYLRGRIIQVQQLGTDNDNIYFHYLKFVNSGRNVLRNSFVRLVGRNVSGATVLELAVFRHRRSSSLLFSKVQNNRMQNHAENLISCCWLELWQCSGRTIFISAITYDAEQ